MVTPLLLLAACVKVWTPVVRAPGAPIPAEPSGLTVSPTHTAVGANGAATLKVHLKDGKLWILDRWQEDTATRALTGFGTLFNIDRTRVRVDSMRVPFDSVALLESYGVRSKGSFGLGLLAVWSATATAVTVSCLADPKSCFGSCPTFYLEGDTSVVHAEGFSGSPLRVLEERDVDHLFRLDPPAGPLVIMMRNEAQETHAVQQVRLHVLNRPLHGRVYHASDDTFRPATRITASSRCVASTGDCRERVHAMDDAEWSSRTDATDLGVREQIELAFHATDLGIDSTRPASIGLVIGGRNTLVSTFVFYQALAYAGSRAGDMLAAFERGTKADLPPVFATLRDMATIRVEMSRPGGTWRPVGQYVEAGPIASDVRVLPITLPPGQGSIRFRLTLAQGFWRLNQLSLALIGEPVTAVTLTPVSVEHRAGSQPVPPTRSAAWNPLALLTNEEDHLITYPGDEYAMHFVLPPRERNGAREVFLESTGYYYEWMRKEWLPEENAAKAAQLLYAPSAALKALAPLFKAREAHMDSIFWRSRVGGGSR